MKILTKLTSSIALTGILLSTATWSNSTVIDPDFNRLDTSRDGLISWPEYASRNPVSGRINPRRIFDNVDKNLDGYITPAEFEAMKRRRRG